MIGYIFLAVIKILDNIILTAKSLATYKEQKILSSVLVVISQLIFYLVIEQVIEDNTMLAIVIVSVSSGVGNLIAFFINDRLKQDDKWTMVVTSSSYAGLKEFCDYLKSQNIKYVCCNGYNRNWHETINVIVFSKTKDESRLINKYLENSDFKYLLEVI